MKSEPTVWRVYVSMLSKVLITASKVEFDKTFIKCRLPDDTVRRYMYADFVQAEKISDNLYSVTVMEPTFITSFIAKSKPTQHESDVVGTNIIKVIDSKTGRISMFNSNYVSVHKNNVPYNVSDL